MVPACCQAVVLDFELGGTRWLYVLHGRGGGGADVSATSASLLFRTKDPCPVGVGVGIWAARSSVAQWLRAWAHGSEGGTLDKLFNLPVPLFLHL